MFNQLNNFITSATRLAACGSTCAYTSALTGAEDNAMQSNNLDVLTVAEIEEILGIEPELTFNQNLAAGLLADEAIEILNVTTARINARLAQGIALSDASNKWDRIARARARRVNINVF